MVKISTILTFNDVIRKVNSLETLNELERMRAADLLCIQSEVFNVLASYKAPFKVQPKIFNLRYNIFILGL